MSLIYRSIFSVGPSEVFATSESVFRSWATRKYPGLSIAAGELTELKLPAASIEATLTTAGDGQLRGLESTLVEEKSDARWMTRLRVLSDGRDRWVWVDLERVAQNVYGRVDVVAPGLVRELLAALPSPRLGLLPLNDEAEVIARPSEVKSKLADLVLAGDREIPLIVFSHSQDDEVDRTVERAERAAQILAGVARVFVVAPKSQQQFEELLGRDLSVWGGGARMYLPGALDPWRHRYLAGNFVRRHRDAAGMQFARMISGAIAARRAPSIYERVRPLLRAAGGRSIEEELAVAELEVTERNATIDELRASVEMEQGARLDVLAEVESLQVELADLQRKVNHWRRLAEAGDELVQQVSFPDSPSSLEEVAEWVRRYLTNVDLPDDACRDLAEIDTAIEAQTWANTSWRAFRALHAYAAEAADFEGGFWQWCSSSGNPDTWPATHKKLAMTESETVASNPKFKNARMLPVSESISSSGQIEMLAHMKIAEGGGGQAPRIYFYDGTATTGKMHVGFFGPHRYMPNTKTN